MAKQQVIDFTSVLKNHQNTWVALTSKLDQVVAAAPTPKQALEKARKKGYEKPYIFWAASDYGGVIPLLV